MNFTQKNLVVYLVTLFSLNLFAGFFHLYYILWWFDMPMHLLGGVVVGMGFLTVPFFARFLPRYEKKTLAWALSGILFVFVVGFLWELFEYVVQAYTHADLANVLDSFSDLCFDIAGGALVMMLALWE
jgi:hypothetical protein